LQYCILIKSHKQQDKVQRRVKRMNRGLEHVSSVQREAERVGLGVPAHERRIGTK